MSRSGPPLYSSSRRPLHHLALAVLLLCLLLPRTARAELELELGLFNRFTLKRDEVQRRLLYDTSTQAFAGRSYLTPSLDDIYYSFLARAGVVWKPRKWIALGLSVDSGELRPVGNLPEETTLTLSLPAAASLLGSPTVQTTGTRSPVTANGQHIRDEARETFFIRQAFVRLQAPETEWLVADLGRFESELSGGLIYGDYGLGVRLLFDLELLKGKPFRLSSRLLLPTRTWTTGMRSPLLELRGEYVLSLLETIGLSLTYYHDGDNNFGALFVPVISEAAVKLQPTLDPDLHRDLFSLFLSTGAPSRANLAWITLDANKYFGDLQLSASFVVEVGHLSLDNIFQVLTLLGKTPATEKLPKGDTLEVSTLGFALDLSARYLITEKLALGGFFLYLSGDGNPLLNGGERYGSFLGVVPHLTQTNLFFSGGMNETFSGRQASTSGIDGRGVIAAGLNGSWELRERFRVGATAAVLFSQESSPISGGRFYGQETDLEASVAITSFLRLSLEYDVLWGGNFYAASGVTHKLLCGLDLTYER